METQKNEMNLIFFFTVSFSSSMIYVFIQTTIDLQVVKKVVGDVRGCQSYQQADIESVELLGQWKKWFWNIKTPFFFLLGASILCQFLTNRCFLHMYHCPLNRSFSVPFMEIAIGERSKECHIYIFQPKQAAI